MYSNSFCFKANRAGHFPLVCDLDSIVEWLEMKGFEFWDRAKSKHFADRGLVEFILEHPEIRGAYTVGRCDESVRSSFWIRFCTRKDALRRTVFFMRTEGPIPASSYINYSVTYFCEDYMNTNYNICFDTYDEFSEYISENMEY